MPDRTSKPQLLMCPPDHLSSHHLFNPWMEWHEEADRGLAGEEWRSLRDALERSGAVIRVVAPVAVAPAMTFTRDAVLAVGASHVVLRNDGPRGESEPVLFAGWLRAEGLPLRWLPRSTRLDGGNILRTRDARWLIGMKPGTGERGARWLARRIRADRDEKSVGIPLADVRYLHLDMVLADLAGRGWLVYPKGFAEPDLSHPVWTGVLRDRPVIEVDDEEASQLSCNVVVVGETVIAGSLSDRLRAAIEALGLSVETVPLDEFRKAGGGAHCLTTELSAVP